MADYKDLESFETFLAIIARLRGPDGNPILVDQHV